MGKEWDVLGLCIAPDTSCGIGPEPICCCMTYWLGAGYGMLPCCCCCGFGSIAIMWFMFNEGR